MKKLAFTGFIAASVLLMTGCSEDNTLTQQPTEGGNVTFTVSLPANGIGSRSFADGLSADKLEYAVYDADDNSLVASNSQMFNNSLTTTVSLALANGKSYKIAFFAHNDNGTYTFSAAENNVTVHYDQVGEYESVDNDCFYKLHETGKVTGPINQSVTLKRPVAQINWGTSDLAEPAVTATNNYGANAANLQTKVEIKGVCDKLDLLTGEVTGDLNVTFAYRPRPNADDEIFPVQPEKYAYVSMNYILVPAVSSIVEATLTPNNLTQDNTPVVVANLPVQANYRTNIYGALLTSPSDFNVTKDENFDTPDNNLEYVQVATASDFVSAVNANAKVIEVPANTTVDIKDQDMIALNNGQTLVISGELNTKREQISISGEGNVATVTGPGKITSVGVEGAVGNRPLNALDGGTLIVKNLTVETEQNNGGSAIFSQDGHLDLEKVTVDCHNYAVGANGGTFKAKGCVFNSDSNNREGAFSYTVGVMSGCKATIEDCVVNGVQGGIAVNGNGSVADIYSGTFSTHDINGYNNSYHALYVANEGVANVYGGNFSVERQGAYAVLVSDEDISLPLGIVNLYGGNYSGKAYVLQNIDGNRVTQEATLPTGYAWQEITDDPVYKWTVVKE